MSLEHLFSKEGGYQVVYEYWASMRPGCSPKCLSQSLLLPTVAKGWPGAPFSPARDAVRLCMLCPSSGVAVFHGVTKGLLTSPSPPLDDSGHASHLTGEKIHRERK